MRALRAKREATTAVRTPQLARVEVVDKATRGRFEVELDAALKRKPTNEAKLGGALRALATVSPALRGVLGEVAATLLRRGSLQRELYSASMRALAEAHDKQSLALLKSALAGDEAGGSPALSAACFSREQELGPLLAKIAASRQSHLAFGAELARVSRGESNGAHLTALAPMIKESHRISMCVELFVPLVRAKPIPPHVGPALTVLRGAERHLGRWLVLGEVAVKSGDRTPIQEAHARAEVGPSSARAAWSLVLWALAETVATTTRDTVIAPPQTRPTLELVARLSDRPSADRDTTFLFRMARAGATVTRAMLEALCKQAPNDPGRGRLVAPVDPGRGRLTAPVDPGRGRLAAPLTDEIAIRAALYLAKDYGRAELREALLDAATGAKREELRGIAAAALWDASAPADAGAERAGGGNGEDTLRMRERAREIADDLVASKVIGNVAWGALIRAASKIQGGRSGAGMAQEPLVAETPFRWIQWGWLE
jgi:hypothetical protein